MWTNSIAQTLVTSECLVGGGVDGHDPRPLAFRVVNRDHSLLKVDAFAFQVDHLPDSHASNG